MKKVLIVGPAWVGDMVMAQALFRRLKRLSPEAELHVVAPGWSLPLTNRMPEVHIAHPLKLGHGEFGFATRKELGERLAEERFDTAFILPRSWKSALVPYYARIPSRIGLLGEMRFGLINQWRKKIRKPDNTPKPRTVDGFVALADPKEPVVRRSEWPVLSAAPDAAEVFQALGVSPGDAPIVFCPGAEYGPAKQWPLEHFVELGRMVASQGHRVLIAGSNKDAPVAQQLAAEIGLAAESIAGRTSLGQVIDVLSEACGVVSNDSGLMHVAAALQRPTVALFGSSSEKVTPPLSDTAHVLSRELPCRPCFKRTCPLQHLDCLTGLTPQMAASALYTALGRS